MRDYYEVLEVSQDATDDEIRRSYRKLALKLHPDRNFGNVEEATDKFAEVQSAYEVLSEPNERAWYDKNRDSILRGTQFDDVGTGAYTADEIGLTPEEILAYVPRLASCKLDDTPGGFFSLAHTLFEHLHRDEITACVAEGTDCPPVPSFGGTQTDDARVISFYKAWSGFSSSKKFDWAERYPFERSHDRRFRRLVDKENAKLRLAARRAYNDAVGQVLSAVRKRDFRLPDSSVGAAQRQAAAAALRKEQQEQARLKKQADRAEYQEQDWQKVQGQQAMEEEMQQFEEFALEIECVACSKTFKSEKQYAGHARSKKHLQTVKRLKWEMKKEARELGLDSDFESDSDADEEAYRTCEEDAGDTAAVPVAVASQAPQADQQESHPVDVASELDVDALTLSERDSDDDHETPPPSPPPMPTPPKKTNNSKRKKQQAKVKLRK